MATFSYRIRTTKKNALTKVYIRINGKQKAERHKRKRSDKHGLIQRSEKIFHIQTPLSDSIILILYLLYTIFSFFSIPRTRKNDPPPKQRRIFSVLSKYAKR